MSFVVSHWTKTLDEWQTTLSDTRGRVWQATLRRASGSSYGDIVAAALYVARSSDGAPIGGRYTSCKGFLSFADAEKWIYGVLERI